MAAAQQGLRRGARGVPPRAARHIGTPRGGGAADGGQAATEYICALVLVGVMVVIITLAGGPAIAESLKCHLPPLIERTVAGAPQGAAPAGCVGGGSGGDGEDPGGGPGGGGGDGDPVARPTPGPTSGPVQECAKDVVVRDGRTWVGVDCRYVPLPEPCPDVDPAGVTPEQARAAIDCAGGSHGPPSPDQDEPGCRDTLPGTVPDVDRTNAQVGCRVYVVPAECAPALEAVEALPPASVEAAQASQALAGCITTWYDRHETPCVVSQSLDVDRAEIVALFFIKVADERSLLVEELGDGRIRVHVLNGGEFGVQASTPEGVAPSAEVGFLTGFRHDFTYEFATKADAQTWIDWHKGRKVSLGPRGGFEVDTGDEPTRRRQSTARTGSKKVTAKFTVDGSVPIGGGGEGGTGDRTPEDPPRGTFTGKVEVEVEEEVEYEDRELTAPAGWRVQTYKTSDKLAAAMLLTLGGNAGRFGADIKAALEGGEVKGTLSVTQVRRGDGTLDRLVVTVDDTLMNTLYDIGIDASAILPYGFTAKGGWSRKQETGTAKVVQTVLPVEDLSPAAAARASTLADELFPRDDDGALESDDIDFGADADALGDLVEDRGTTRTVDYGVERTTETVAGGLDFAGLPLLQITSISQTETQDLQASELEVVDVDGRRRVVSPAPACDLRTVDPATYPYDPPEDLRVHDGRRYRPRGDG